MPNLRVISGELKSRKIFTQKNHVLRPTPERIREQLASWLRPHYKNKNCLDLFAGSGSLGIEALSNGAITCTFVEQNPEVNRNLIENLKKLDLAEKSNVLRNSAENFVRRAKGERYDIIFFDPPYQKNYYEEFLNKTILNLSKRETIIYIENSSKNTEINNQYLELTKASTVGNVAAHLYRVNIWRLRLLQERQN